MREDMVMKDGVLKVVEQRRKRRPRTYCHLRVLKVSIVLGLVLLSLTIALRTQSAKEHVLDCPMHSIVYMLAASTLKSGEW